MDKASTIIADIYAVDDLAEMRRINAAAADRIRNLSALQAAQVKASVAPGDRFALSGLSPKYMNGLVVEATGDPCGGKRVSVRLVGQSPFRDRDAQRAASRYFIGGTSKVPATCLIPVD